MQGGASAWASSARISASSIIAVAYPQSPGSQARGGDGHQRGRERLLRTRGGRDLFVFLFPAVALFAQKISLLQGLNRVGLG